MNEAVRVERSGPVTTVVLQRPEVRNAVDRPTADELARAFADFDEDDDAAVAVLYGAGGTFCAGADLKALADPRGERRNRVEDLRTGSACSRLDPTAPMGPTRMLLSKPVVAAVSGYAVAGGLELALWCDLRVAEQSAVFGVFCRRWGVPLVDGGTVRLPRLVGHGRAMELILTGRAVGAAEALQMGLVTRVVPDGTVREAAETLAHELARLPATCMRSDRLSAIEQWDLPFDEAMANELRRGRATIASGETTRGAARFAEGHGRGGSFEGQGRPDG